MDPGKCPNRKDTMCNIQFRPFPGSRNFQKLIYLYPYLLTIQIENVGISGNELRLKISKAQKVLKGNFLSDQYKLKYTLKLILVFLISRHKSGSLFTFTSSTKQRKLYLIKKF